MLRKFKLWRMWIGGGWVYFHHRKQWLQIINDTGMVQFTHNNGIAHCTCSFFTRHEYY